MTTRIPLMRTLAALGLTSVIVSSCDAPSEPLGELALVVVSGSGQEAPPNTELPAPLVVKVTDSRGRTVAGQVVNFNVIEGGGSVYAGVAITNSRGLAQERWTLGPSGTQQSRPARSTTTPGQRSTSGPSRPLCLTWSLRRWKT